MWPTELSTCWFRWLEVFCWFFHVIFINFLTHLRRSLEENGWAACDHERWFLSVFFMPQAFQPQRGVIFAWSGSNLNFWMRKIIRSWSFEYLLYWGSDKSRSITCREACWSWSTFDLQMYIDVIFGLLWDFSAQVPSTHWATNCGENMVGSYCPCWHWQVSSSLPFFFCLEVAASSTLSFTPSVCWKICSLNHLCAVGDLKRRFVGLEVNGGLLAKVQTETWTKIGYM